MTEGWINSTRKYIKIMIWLKVENWLCQLEIVGGKSNITFYFSPGQQRQCYVSCPLHSDVGGTSQSLTYSLLTGKPSLQTSS